MPGLAIGVGLAGANVPGLVVPPIITASVLPAIQSVQEGDTWVDLLLSSATTASNYDSTESVNDPTPVAEVRINGGAWTALAGNEATVLSYDEVADVRVTVTDDQDPANSRVFNAGSTAVAGIAPTYAVNLGAIYPGQTVGIPGSGADVEPVLTGGSGVPSANLTYAISINGLGGPFDDSIMLTEVEAADGNDIAVRIQDADHPTGPFEAFSNVVSVEAAEITAAVTPAMSPLYDGQAVEDVTNWATFIDTANYSSSAAGGTATIVSAVAAFTGDATAADDALVEGETAGFTITVTDSEGNVDAFTATSATVQYAVRGVDEGDGIATIEWNPLAAGSGISRQIPLTIDGTVYNPTLTEGESATGAVNISAPSISSNGTVEGSIFTLDDEGIWATETASVTFATDWKRNGVSLSDADDSYTTVAADLGTAITNVVTGTDANGARDATSNAINMDAAAAGVSATLVAQGTVDKGSRSGDPGVLSAVNVGTDAGDLVVGVVFNSGSGADDMIPEAASVTVGGNTASALIATNPAATPRVHTALLRYSAAISGAVNISVDTTAGSWRAASVFVWRVPGAAAVTVSDEDVGADNSTALATAVAVGDIIIGVAGENNASALSSITNATQEGTTENLPSDAKAVAFKHVVATAETRTVTVAWTGAASSNADRGVSAVLKEAS